MYYRNATDNIVKVCLRLGKNDRLVIISDLARKDIGDAIYKRAKKECETLLLFIEDFTNRPATTLPIDLVNQLKKFAPTASIYAATGQAGELQNFRSPLREILTEEIKLRHAHMINIDKQVMLDGMSQDYKKIQSAVNKVYDLVKKAKEIKVSDKHGTQFTVKLSPNYKWIKDDGLLNKPGKWNNLPAGEVFSYPAKFDGTIAGFIVGDYFSDKYGLLKHPIIIDVKRSRVVSIKGKNKKLNDELTYYLKTDKNSDRVGELGIGCLLGLTKLTGNLLQDEKYPGVHVAFGSPYPEKTGAKWDSTTHVDVIPLGVNIEVVGREIMRSGEYVVDLG